MEIVPAISRWTQKDYLGIAANTNISQFLTLGISHYVELARWSLDIDGARYEEHAFAPFQHVLPVLSVRVAGERNHLSDSSYVRPVLKDTQYSAEKDKPEQRRATAVPLLVLNNGLVLKDSWQIASNSSVLLPISQELKSLLDEELGPLSRQFAYHFLLSKRNRKYFDAACKLEQPWWWRLCWNLFLGNTVVNYMSKLFKVNDNDSFDMCISKLEKLFLTLDPLVKGRTTKYLSGDSLGVADIALASLCGPLVFPKLYAKGKYTAIFDECIASDDKFQTYVYKWSNTATGFYALQIYETRLTSTRNNTEK